VYWHRIAYSVLMVPLRIYSPPLRCCRRIVTSQGRRVCRTGTFARGGRRTMCTAFMRRCVTIGLNGQTHTNNAVVRLSL